jgi:hypothetical protein
MPEEDGSFPVSAADSPRRERGAEQFFGRSNISKLLSPKFMTLELILALLLVIAALIYAWPEIKGMATTSLWQDELYTIARFSSRGPNYVMTNYNANNHILFNILNSLTIGKHPFQPFSARFWSFVCLILTIAVTLLYYALARRPFDGGAQLFLLMTNVPAIDLALQARGYGFLAFGALLCTVLAWHYFRHPSLISLIGLPLVVWLATWTAPTFVFFGGGLLLVMLAYSRDRRWLVSGVCTLIAIVVVYWPVHAALLQSVNGYSEHWGKQFANWNAISDLLSNYLLFRSASWLTFSIAILVVIALCRGRVRSAKAKASLCAGSAILATLAICLNMGTPPQRTVAYLVAPIAFILVTVLTELFRKGVLRKFRLQMMTVAVAAAFGFALHAGKGFHFRPIEAWLETAHRIEKHFPKGTEVVAQFRPQWLRVYLSADYPLTNQLDTAKFISGKQIVLDSSFLPKDRFQIDKLPEGYALEMVPQRRGGKQTIYFWPADRKGSFMPNTRELHRIRNRSKTHLSFVPIIFSPGSLYLFLAGRIPLDLGLTITACS